MINLLFKSSVRIIRKQLTLSVVKIAGLAIGMATFLITALYCLHEWSFDKQHPGWENVYRYVHRVKSQDELQSFAFTAATTGPALKERYSEVVDFTRIFKIEVSLKRKDSDVGFAEKKFAFADANFLEFFSFPIIHGHHPAILSEPYHVILTPASAEKYFGDSDPVGKTLLLNGAIELVVQEVFESNFSRTHMDFDFVASFATLEAIKNHPVVSKQIPASLNLDHKGFNAFYTYLRLTSPAASVTLMEKLPSYIEEFRGKGRSERLKPTLQRLASIHLHSDMLYEIDKNSSETIVFVYMLVGILILVVAIINYINISTAEFLIRAKNVGLKKVLGITRGSLLLGHLLETMTICAFAMLLAGALTVILIVPFNAVMHTTLSFFTPETILPFLTVYISTVLLTELLPAFQILRQDALIAFRGDQKTGRSSLYLRNSLVFLQMMVSFVLLAIALLVVRQTDYLLQKDTGFDTEQIMVVNTAGMGPDERLAFRDNLKANEAIENVSMCSVPPGESLFTFGLTLPGASGDEDRRITFYHMFVDENLLQTLGVDIGKGRFFQSDIAADSLNSLVVNQAAADIIHDSLMNRQIEIPNIYSGKPSRKMIVGVIGDFHFASFHTAVEPLVLEYNPRYARYLLVRFQPDDVNTVIENLGRTWKDYAPLLPLNYYFMDDNFAQYYAAEQRTKQVVMIVSWLAVILTAMGIFGTSLFLVQQRTKEIGIRKLLGSATTELFTVLFRTIFLIFIVACCVGIPLSIWIGEKWLNAYPYRTDFSMNILVAAFAIMLAVILLTVSTYIVRIMRVQPAQVLKNQ
ncbi:MAG TPA: FtsX-like permease family protein [Chryseosolibacter sp.]|nr:FtsX-like permease family protein [Chryseosolibacter sp.]